MDGPANPPRGAIWATPTKTKTTIGTRNKPRPDKERPRRSADERHDDEEVRGDLIWGINEAKSLYNTIDPKERKKEKKNEAKERCPDEERRRTCPSTRSSWSVREASANPP